MSEQLTIKSPGEFARYLEKSKQSIANALPKHLNADRMLRLAVTAFSTNPALRQCTPVSIVGSIIVASQLGLEPGIAGQGYLIPYKETCTFVPGWQGLVGMLNNTGRATAWTAAVFEGDEFQCDLGSMQRIVHRPGPNYGDPGKITWVYACGKVNGSEIPIIEAWPMARVFKHRDRFNKVGQRHYSFAHPEMYARKVVLLQVLKYLPRSIELQNAMAVEENHEAGKSSTIGEGGIVLEADLQPAGEGEGQGATFIQGRASDVPAGEETQEAPQTAQEPATMRKRYREGPEAAKAPQSAPESQEHGFELAGTEPTTREKLASLMIERSFTEAQVLEACAACKIKTGKTLKETPDGTIAVLVKDFNTLAGVVKGK